MPKLTLDYQLRTYLRAWAAAILDRRWEAAERYSDRINDLRARGATCAR